MQIANPGKRIIQTLFGDDTAAAILFSGTTPDQDVAIVTLPPGTVVAWVRNESAANIYVSVDDGNNSTTIPAGGSLLLNAPLLSIQVTADNPEPFSVLVSDKVPATSTLFTAGSGDDCDFASTGAAVAGAVAAGAGVTKPLVILRRPELLSDQNNTPGVMVRPVAGLDVPSGYGDTPDAPCGTIDTPYDMPMVCVIEDDAWGSLFDAQSALGGAKPFDYLRARGVPVSHAVPSSFPIDLQDHTAGAYMTIPEMRKLFLAGGGELLAHSYGHAGARPTAAADIIREVVGAREQLRNISSTSVGSLGGTGDSFSRQSGTYSPWTRVGAPITGYVVPGTWSNMAFPNEDAALERLVRQNYEYSFRDFVASHYVGDRSQRHLTPRNYLLYTGGLSGVNLATNAANLTGHGARFALLFHASASINWANWKTAIDALVEARDRGTIALVNAKTLMQGISARAGSSRAQWSKLPGGDFDSLPTGDIAADTSPGHYWWWTAESGTPASIVAGDSGMGQCLQVSAGEQAMVRVALRPGTYMLRFKAKSTNGTEVLRVVSDNNWCETDDGVNPTFKCFFVRNGMVIDRTGALLPDPYKPAADATQWCYYKAFGVPDWARFVMLGFIGNSGNAGNIYIDDVEIAPT